MLLTVSSRNVQMAHSESLSFRHCVCYISMALCFRLVKGSLCKRGENNTFRAKDVFIGQSIIAGLLVSEMTQGAC